MGRKIIILIGLICIGCTVNTSNIVRKNPDPIATTPTPTPTPYNQPSGKLGDELPDPIKTPEVKLEDLNFDVKIDFDGILGRVVVDDGALRNTPTEYKLTGGRHKIEIFDLVTSCRIADIFFIDKNQTIDFKGKCN